MKRSIAALTALCAVSGAAWAQSNVTVYGIVDVALVHESGGTAGSMTKVTSGVGTGSRLGFKGVEDLGDGMSALFLLESGFQADTGTLGQGGLLFGRQAYVGLQSRYGMVTLGRQYTPQYLAVATIDPFGSGYAGDTKNLMTATGNGTSRMDNTIKYTSPAAGGVIAELVYAPGEVANDNKAARQFGGGLTYRNGPVMLRLAYHNRNNDTATVKTNENARNLVAGGTYDTIGGTRIHFAYGVNKGLNSAIPRNTANPFGYATPPVLSTDSRDTLVGLTVPFGPHTLLASYIDKNDRTRFNQDAHQVAVGYKYNLSKRTELYAVYAKITNENGAGYTVGSSIEGGTGDKALNLGIKHVF